MRNFRAEALENRDSLPVSRQRQTDGLFAFGESASEVAACGSLSAAGALPAVRATARSPWPEGRSARRGNGLRNYECFPSSQNRPQPKRLTKSQIRPARAGHPAHCKVRPKTRPQCTISSTILSLILSIIPSLVYYKKHTSNLLTLKSESGILWSS